MRAPAVKLPIRTVLIGVRSVTRPAAAEEEATTPAAGRGAERLVFWRKGDAGVRPLDDLVRRRRFQRFLLAFSEKIRWAGSGSSRVTPALPCCAVLCPRLPILLAFSSPPALFRPCVSFTVFRIRPTCVYVYTIGQFPKEKMPLG